MAKSIIRRSLLVLTIFSGILALPAKALAQSQVSSTRTSGQSANGNVEIATLDLIELPDRPTGRSVDSSSVFGRDAYFRADVMALPPEPVIAIASYPSEVKPHHFWDRENGVLFAAVGSIAVADFYVTHANLASGGKELNPVTRILSSSTPGLAANFALETSGVISLSYLFHRTGHHRLERATSLLSIGSSSVAVTYDLAHR